MKSLLPVLIAVSLGLGLVFWRQSSELKGSEVSWGLLSTVEHDFVPTRLQTLMSQTVKIAGFVVPLSDSFSTITEFLLVPDSMSCIHAPPPPENQMVLVRLKVPLEPQLAFGPVWVSGTLSTQAQKHFFGEALFTMEAEQVVVYSDEKWNSQRPATLQARTTVLC